MKSQKPTLAYFLIGTAILMISCAQPETSAEVSETPEALKISYLENDGNEPMAKLCIQGMTCERMCVSKVKSTMASVPGIEVEEMIFDADIPVDTLVIRYNPKLVDQDKMVKTINDIAGGGVYNVRELQITKDGKSSSIEKLPSEKKLKKKKKEKEAYRFSVPNIFDVLKRVSI